MSSIYIQEPPTSGKVLLMTTVGDIEIELWTKETPKTCRNFIKLCYNGYYNSTIFHRVVKGFIVQGGDPTGTGEGGESADGHSIKDEFHSRLRFCRRGLVAMANAGKDTNTSQFFITLGATPELQNKHTIFGKIVGDTIYNVLKLEEAEIDHNERPVYAQKILKTKVLLNPFDDLVPTIVSNKEHKVEKVHKKKATGVKNLKLLSFGEEAEEDEETFDILNKQLSGKSKSAHDRLQDPKLSSYTDAELIEVLNKESESLDTADNKESNDKEKLEDTDKIRMNIKKAVIDKLTSNNSHSTKSKLTNSEDNKYDGENSSSEDFFKSSTKKHQEKLNAIKKEIKSLKKSIRKGDTKAEVEESSKKDKETLTNEILNDYIAVQQQYKKEKTLSQSGRSRESFTLQLLDSFKKKLQDAKEHIVSENTSNNPNDDDNDDEKSWMTHSLHCENQGTVLAKDASTKSDDWFEIYDPRNPINKRRRGDNSDQKKKKKY